MQNSTTNLTNNTKKIIWPDSMIAFGEQCARSWMTKILLYGDLWAGKTHFAKWFLQYFKIPENEISSPTYTYVNDYDIKTGSWKLKAWHFDLYRLETVGDLVGKGLLDFIVESDIVLIEWPKFEEEYIDDDFVKIKIDKVSDEERMITVS